MRRFFMFFTLIMIGSTVSAGNIWMPAGGIRIEKVHGTPDGKMIIYGPPSVDVACESGRLFYIALGQNNVSADGMKMLTSIALTAYATGKNVRLHYDNTTSSCWVNQILIE